MIPESTLNPRMFAVGVLGLTACVLFVGLILATQQPAVAIGMNDRGGDYIVVTQQISNTTEGLVIIDAAAKQMIVYAFDYNNKQLEIISRVPLDQMPKPREPAPVQGGRRGQ